MIRYHLFFLAVMLLFMPACRSRVSTDQSAQIQTDPIASGTKSAMGLAANLSMKDTIRVGGLIELSFTVTNSGDSIQRFCKWHTPFEPFISKYLEITDHNGKEVSYIGAMAKRVMPPPASAYTTVPPGETVTTTVDLSKGYALKEPGTYHVVYIGQGMSEIKTANEATFVLTSK